MEIGNCEWKAIEMERENLAPEVWAQHEFGECKLGDVRRTRRAVRLAAQVAADPSASTPRQTIEWKHCKAAYRLFDEEDVTFQALTAPHQERTRQCAAGHWLLLGDTTELEFGIHREIAGLGPTGDGGGRGFFLHSSLMVRAESAELAGLAGQEIFYRQPRDKNESRYDRVRRERESEVWGRVIDQVGSPPEAARWTHVFDRGADNFEVYCHLLQQRADWVVRAAQLNRRVVAPDGESMPLCDDLATLPVAGTYSLKVAGQRGRQARTAHVAVRHALVRMSAPQHCSPWLQELGIVTIAMWVVEVREVSRPPAGEQPLQWVLYTSHAVNSFDDAWRVIEFYERRWLIEEYHKALKTGCRVEERQYETSQRLEAMVGMMAIVAVRLLELRAAARTEPDRPARELVPANWFETLARMRPRLKLHATVRDFYRQLASLGGFLNRKHDGEPGWQTIWRGFDKLATVMQYVETRQKCG